ncbi:MAG: hypothetical protein L0177_14775, partial [Chloroflexi bacterium]|nr:hypothetical protein [Chloroflexota bacterium]
FEIQSGILLLDGGGTSSGDFIVPVGSTLRFDNNHTLTADSSVSGEGRVRFTSGTVNVNGGYTITGVTEIAGGTANFNSDVSLPVLEMSSGILGGTGAATVSASMNWTGGEMRDGGKTVIDGVLAMTGAGDKNMRGSRTLEVNGTATWDNGALRINEASVIAITATGVFDIVGDRFVDHQFGVQPTINNAGTLKRSAGTGTATIEAFLNNSGTIQVQSGVLSPTDGGAYSGAFEISADAVMQFSGSTHNFNEGATVTGDGTLRINGATVHFNAGIAIPVMAFSSGTLRGTSEVTVTGALGWTGGQMQDSGKTIVDGALTISGTSDKNMRLGRTLEVNGSATWSAGSIRANESATFAITATGVFDIAGDLFMDHQFGAAPIINNAGTLRKTAGTGTATIEAVLNNSGVVEAQSGALNFTQGGTSSGSFVVILVATLEFGGGTHNLNADSSVGGEGRVLVSGGTVNFSGTYSLTGTTEVNGGTLNFNVDVTLPVLEVKSGVLGGTATATVSASMSWTGGQMQDSGKTAINGALTISGTGDKNMRLGRTLEVNNAATWSGGAIRANEGATLSITTTGALDIQGDRFVDHQFGAVPTINNAGAIRKTSGAGTTTIEAIFSNSGDLEILAGTLSLAQGFTQTATGALSFQIGGTTAGADFGQLAVTGAVTFDGTLDISLVNGFVPGSSDTFTLATFGSRTGDFAATTGLDIGDGRSFQVVFAATSLTLVVVE